MVITLSLQTSITTNGARTTTNRFKELHSEMWPVAVLLPCRIPTFSPTVLGTEAVLISGQTPQFARPGATSVRISPIPIRPEIVARQVARRHQAPLPTRH